MKKKITKEDIANFFPIEAQDYCMFFFTEQKFTFIIANSRDSKLGDYRYDSLRKSHTITVNGDLNPYNFMVTFLHEIAHYQVSVKYGIRNVMPHGKEWKLLYGNILRDLTLKVKLPESVHYAIVAESKNPKSSTQASPKLTEALQSYDTNKINSNQFMLKNIAEGNNFKFENDEFQLLTHNRTRSLCLNLRNNRKFLVSKIAWVEKV